MDKNKYPPVIMHGVLESDELTPKRIVCDSAGRMVPAAANNGAFSVTRGVSDTPVGATGGAAGDTLDHIVLTSLATVAALSVVDGSGTVVAIIPTTAVLGTTIDVKVKGGPFVVKGDATGLGTITLIGTFT